MSDPVQYRLVRDNDVTGVSGTGHVGDVVVWPDGTCVLRWRTLRRSTAIYESFDDLMAIHGHGGATRVEPVPEHPYDHGYRNADQDQMENSAFASIGGLEHRTSPRSPAYVTPERVAAWLSGYRDACRDMYGDDWETCEFGWFPAVEIRAASEVSP